MSINFTDYPDLLSVTKNNEITETAFVRKVSKQLRKNNKLLKRIAKICRQQEKREAEAQRVAEAERIRKSEVGRKNKKIFWEKLSDVFLKAIPTVLGAVVTFFAKNIFTHRQANSKFA